MSYAGSALSTVTDAAGRSLTLGWSGGHITSVTDSLTPTARTATFSYNQAGDLTDVVDIGGGHWQFTYDANHRLLTQREPKYYGDTTTSPAPVTTNHYDASGRVDWQSDPLGRQITFDYTSVPGATKVTDPAGHVQVHAYDSNGLLTSRTEGYGTAQAVTWTYAHDPATLGIIAVIDPNGGLTSTSYDQAGNVTSTTDPLGRTTATTSNGLGLPLTVTDPAGVTTTSTYDAAGNVLTVSTPLVGSNPAKAKGVTYSYGDTNHPGDVTGITDPDGKTWGRSYDSAGNVVSETDPLGNVTSYCYDAVGRRTKEIAPKGTAAGVTCATASPTFTTTFTTNAFGQVLTVTDPLGHQTASTYDLNGNRSSTQDADGHTTTPTYDPANQLIEVARADSSTLHYDYNADGTLWRYRDAANNAITYGYDTLGRVTTVADPLNRTTTYGYDPLGNRTSKQDPGGSCTTSPVTGCTTMRYDGAGQLVGITYSDGITPNISYGYDINGRRISMTDGTGTSTWAWDSLGRLTATTNGAGKTMSYGYDLRGNVTSITYPGTTGTVTRIYDDAGNLQTITDWLSHQTTYTYDPDGFLTGQAYPNGTDATYTPDGADNVAAISHAPTANPSNPFASFTYGRTNAGLLNSVTSTGVPADTHTYSYTALGQLQGVDGTNVYAHDAADNLTAVPGPTTQAYDVANQLTTVGGVTYSYDQRGNRTAAGQTTYSYDQANRLTKITAPLSGDPYATAVQADTPAHYWKLDETSGTTATDSGGTSPGTYHGGFTLGATGAMNTTPPDRAVTFNGTAGTNVTATFTAPATNVTLEAWVNLPDTNRSGAFIKVGDTKGYGLGVGNGNFDNGSSGNHLIALYENVRWIDSGVNIGTGWHHVALTINTGGTATFFIDGTQVAQSTGNAPQTPETSTGVGGYTTGGHPRWFNGTLEDVAIYPSALSGTAIAGHYNAGRGATTFTYNGDGLRTAKTTWGGVTQYTWDTNGELPLLLVDGTTNYLYGPGGVPLEQVTSDGTVTYYHHDQLGSTRALTNGAGTVMATYTYDAYGAVAGSTGSAINPFGYAGQYTDPETGLQYLRARYYDPTTGTFLTRDPLEAATGAPYSYASDDPLNEADPTGLCVAGLFGKHCHIAQTLTIAAAVVGGTALLIGTGGVAAAAAPELIAGFEAAELAATTIAEGSELVEYGTALSSASNFLSAGSTALSFGAAGASCAHARDLNCLANGALAFGGLGATVGGFLTPATEALRSLGLGALGFGMDLAGFVDYTKMRRC